MNALRGAKEFELGGRKRLIKFGANQTEVFCDLKGMNVGDFLRWCEMLDKLEVEVAFARDLTYSGLVAGCRTNKEEVDFDHYEVGDWLDEAGNETGREIMELFREAFGPNSARPQKGAKQNQKK